MSKKVLGFPRPEIMPMQTHPTYCFAATSIGILEYYTQRLWPYNQQEVAAEHNQSRANEGKKVLNFGSPSYILKIYKCYNGSQKLGNNNPRPDQIYNTIKKEIKKDRPIIVGINGFHCGIVYGYHDVENGTIYATDPGEGITRPGHKERFKLMDFLFKYRGDGTITELIFTKNGFAEGVDVPVRNTADEVDAMLSEIDF